jgi:hypothetical protein
MLSFQVDYKVLHLTWRLHKLVKFLQSLICNIPELGLMNIWGAVPLGVNIMMLLLISESKSPILNELFAIDCSHDLLHKDLLDELLLLLYLCLFVKVFVPLHTLDLAKALGSHSVDRFDAW